MNHCIRPKQIDPVEIDVQNIKDTKYQKVIKKLLVFKYTDEGSLDVMRLYKTEEFLHMELMKKNCYRKFDFIIYKKPKITLCTAVSLTVQNFILSSFTKLCPMFNSIDYCSAYFGDKLKKTNENL